MHAGQPAPGARGAGFIINFADIDAGELELLAIASNIARETACSTRIRTCRHHRDSLLAAVRTLQVVAACVSGLVLKMAMRRNERDLERFVEGGEGGVQRGTNTYLAASRS